jgi:TolB-like protein/DNA-binding winged helix-turn-helix (wHTH) protein/Tfp pilus assembly protein PilF
MDALNSADMLLLGAFRFDRRSRTLLQIDSSAQIPIGSRALGVLGILVERAGQLVPKDEIMRAVWPETVVEDANLTVHISTLRRLLDAGRLEGSCIQTVSGRGYRFVGPVIQTDTNGCPAVETLEPRNVRTRPSLSIGATPFATVSDNREPQYTLSAEPVAALPTREGRTTSPEIRTSFLRRYGAAVALAGVLIIAGGVWWLRTLQMMPSAAVTARPLDTVTMAARPAQGLSVVVLPFATLSDDREQQHFTDGVTADLTTDLSLIPGFLVIGRNTAFNYKGRMVDAKQIGRELGVRYVLEGSIRRSGNQVRSNVQLIDAENNLHLWAERFDQDIGNVFPRQNEIVGRLANSLGLALVRSEASRRIDNPSAQDYRFRARAAAAKPSSREKYAEAIDLFERALAMDPQLPPSTKSVLAVQYTGRVLDGMTDTAAADIARAEELVGPALAAAPHSADAHHAKGQLLRVQRRCAEAISEYETALAYSRNNVGALSHIAGCKILLGVIDEAIPLLEQAIILTPQDYPRLHEVYLRLGQARLLQSRTEDAIVWFAKSRSAHPTYPHVHAWLAAAYALKGETDDAAAELAEARRLGGEGYMSSMARLRADSRFETPAGRTLRDATYFTGLRKAGVPEE